MNGFGLLVLLTLQSQIGSQPALNTQNRDFGWQIAKDDGVLEYIVQVSPEEAAKMQANGFENASDIPPDLRGRIGRIVFRIGTTNLPQTPSINAIRQIPRYTEQADLTDALGRGSFADVEDSPLMNVNQQPLGNSLPAFNPPDDRASSSSSNPIDRASALARERALGSSALGDDPSSQFLGGAAGGSSRTGSSFSDNPLPSANRQTPGNIPGTTKFDSTGRGSVAGGQRPGVDDWEAQNRLDAQRREELRREEQRQLEADQRLEQQRLADARGGASYGNGAGYDNNYARDDLAAKYRDREAPSLDMGNFGALPSRPSPGQRTPVNGFGSTPGSAGFDDGYRNGNDGRVANNGNLMDSRNGNGGSGYGGGGYGGNGYGGGGPSSFGNPNSNGNMLAGGQAGQYGGPIRNELMNGRNGQPAGNENSMGLGTPDTQTAFQAGVWAAQMSAAKSGLGADGMPVDPFSRVASNNGAPNNGPSTSPNSGTLADETSPGDRNGGDRNGKGKSQAGAVSDESSTSGNVFAQMFLVVSLVANVYLVYVLRRLLTRHRSVLTKLRSQTA